MMSRNAIREQFLKQLMPNYFSIKFPTPVEAPTCTTWLMHTATKEGAWKNEKILQHAVDVELRDIRTAALDRMDGSDVVSYAEAVADCLETQRRHTSLHYLQPPHVYERTLHRIEVAWCVCRKLLHIIEEVRKYAKAYTPSSPTAITTSKRQERMERGGDSSSSSDCDSDCSCSSTEEPGEIVVRRRVDVKEVRAGGRWNPYQSSTATTSSSRRTKKRKNRRKRQRGNRPPGPPPPHWPLPPFLLPPYPPPYGYPPPPPPHCYGGR